MNTVLLLGWFWSATGIRLGPTDDAKNGHWGPTGGDGRAQPDNREFRVTVREIRREKG